MTSGSGVCDGWRIGAPIGPRFARPPPAATARPTLVATDRHSRRRRMRPRSTAGSRSCAVTPRREAITYTVNPDGSDEEQLFFEGRSEGPLGLHPAPRSRSTAATTGCPRTSWIPKPVPSCAPCRSRNGSWRHSVAEQMVSRRRADRLRGLWRGRSEPERHLLDPCLRWRWISRTPTTWRRRHPRRLLARRTRLVFFRSTDDGATNLRDQPRWIRAAAWCRRRTSRSSPPGRGRPTEARSCSRRAPPKTTVRSGPNADGSSAHELPITPACGGPFSDRTRSGASIPRGRPTGRRSCSPARTRTGRTSPS